MCLISLQPQDTVDEVIYHNVFVIFFSVSNVISKIPLYLPTFVSTSLEELEV